MRQCPQKPSKAFPPGQVKKGIDGRMWRCEQLSQSQGSRWVRQKVPSKALMRDSDPRTGALGKPYRGINPRQAYKIRHAREKSKLMQGSKRKVRPKVVIHYKKKKRSVSKNNPLRLSLQQERRDEDKRRRDRLARLQQQK